MKFLNKIQKFMYGRNGLDTLNMFLFQIYFLIFILNFFMKSIILSIVALFLVVITLFRMTSKNIYARSKENVFFIKIKKKLLKPFNDIKRNFKDKDHVYKKCHHCKTVLKLPLPNKRGFKKVKCPECKKRNKFLILKKMKIELIKNNKKKSK